MENEGKSDVLHTLINEKTSLTSTGFVVIRYVSAADPTANFGTSYRVLIHNKL